MKERLGTFVSELCKDSLHLTEKANKMFLDFIERLFHTTSTQKSGTLRKSFSHLYSTTIFHKVGTKVLDFTGNLLINPRT